MPQHSDTIRLKDLLAPAEFLTEHPPAPSQDATGVATGPIEVPDYEILEELGRGGMGVVYKARQLRLNRTVALKVIIGGALAGPVERARFRLEAEAGARLQHENIVQVYDVGTHEGTDYIAFEYVDGPTLRRWQDQRPLEPMLAARLASAVARGIQHAHDRGVVHRDLKPANILLSGARSREQGTASAAPDEPVTVPDSRNRTHIPKVMDFGLAKSLEDGGALTLSGATCGTPNYMAPEQVRGGPDAAQTAVDVWGVGAVLFELLTGRPPFIGWNAACVMQDILLLEPPSVRRLVAAIPYDLTVVVSKCLEKDPRRRYLSPGDVADDLDRFLAGRPIRARAVGLAGRMRRWIARNPLATAMGVLLAAGLAAVGTLAVKLDDVAQREREAAERERQALLEEERHRLDAEAARKAAESARDETAAALAEVQRTLARANAERDRAEINLGIARRTISNVLGAISAHSERNNAAFVPVYRELLARVEPFVAQLLGQKPDDRDLRFERAIIARNRGYLENTAGRAADAHAQLQTATRLLAELVRDRPGDRAAWQELGAALACLGEISLELNKPEAGKQLRDALELLTTYCTGFPKDAAAHEGLIRVHFALARTSECRFCDEHERAVLDIVDRLPDMGVPQARVRMLRAHALNNIASALTNRDKTDEAELYWKEVLAIREDLVKQLPADKVMRYELAKCLINCSNQLYKTGRDETGFHFRRRAALLFDTLTEDAANRAMYAGLMLDNDVNLAVECCRRGQPELALDRLSHAIELAGAQLAQEPSAAALRGKYADLHTRRAEVNEQLKHHAQAAEDYQKAAEHSTQDPHRDYCTARRIQSLVRAGQGRAAFEMARKVNLDAVSHPFACLEMTRGWLLLLKAAAGELKLSDAERAEATRLALENARLGVRIALKKNWFQQADNAKAFHADKDFEPVWELVP